MHIVFFGTDAGGAALVDENGNPADILVIDDGRPGDLLQNCSVDGGEVVSAYTLSNGVTFGATSAGVVSPDDNGGGAMATGSTFTDAGGLQASWVLFRPEGFSLSFSANCTTGAIGTGAGAIYLTNGARDHVIVVSPMGLSRSHTWDVASVAWRL